MILRVQYLPLEFSGLPKILRFPESSGEGVI